tara:strand:- start:273 stop:740 length:468 start_codon:yes stop_codon:yes gene_type:complete
MSDNYKALKFEMNKPVTVQLAFDEPTSSFSEKFNKTNYWYGIKELINGENGFNATQKLHESIQGLNKKKGDTIIIQKVNNGKFTYFTVDENSLIKENEPRTNTTGGDILMKDVKPSVPIEARVNDLEKQVKDLVNWKNSLVDNAKKDLGDDDIPF